MFPNSTTTEQLAKSFLTDISRRYRGGFHLSEKRIGRCWSCNCKETKGFPRYCMANDCCLLPNENGQLDYLLYSKGKLEFIWNNSILANSPNTINKLKALC